jgi:hypothetical protein
MAAGAVTCSRYWFLLFIAYGGGNMAGGRNLRHGMDRHAITRVRPASPRNGALNPAFRKVRALRGAGALDMAGVTLLFCVWWRKVAAFSRSAHLSCCTSLQRCALTGDGIAAAAPPAGACGMFL